MSNVEPPVPADPRRSALKFPCRFPIKAVGEGGEALRARVVAIARAHATDLDDEDIWMRPSRNGRFVSVTMIVNADSQAQLDAIYLALRAEPMVSVVL